MSFPHLLRKGHREQSQEESTADPAVEWTCQAAPAPLAPTLDPVRGGTDGSPWLHLARLVSARHRAVCRWNGIVAAHAPGGSCRHSVSIASLSFRGGTGTYLQGRKR